MTMCKDVMVHFVYTCYPVYLGTHSNAVHTDVSKYIIFPCEIVLEDIKNVWFKTLVMFLFYNSETVLLTSKV
jgi:hypothetical protein